MFHSSILPWCYNQHTLEKMLHNSTSFFSSYFSVFSFWPIVLGDTVKKSAVESRRRIEGTKETNCLIDLSTHMSAYSIHFTFTADSQSSHMYFPGRHQVPFNLSLSTLNEQNKSLQLKHRNPFNVQCYEASVCPHYWVGSSTANIIILQSFFLFLSTLSEAGLRMMKTHFHYAVASPHFNLNSRAH